MSGSIEERAGRPRACGAALVIALVLLLILTLLASTGMRMSIAELWMAGNEQYRRKASDAASAGIEVAITAISALRAPPLVTGNSGSDAYEAAIRYTGNETSLPGSSAEKFAGEHFEIESVGTSARHARDVQTQGVMVIFPANGVKTFTREGAGLEMAGAP
jgi:Tfp pilus assembly protein PilX